MSDFVFFIVGLCAGSCIILTLLWLAELNIEEKPDGPDRTG